MRFDIGKSIGDIHFNMDVETIINLKGTPLYIDNTDPDFNVVRLFFDDFSVFVYNNFENKDIETVVHVNQIDLSEFKLKVNKTTRTDLIEVIKEIYLERNLNYHVVCLDHDNLSEMLEFPEIGLTAWIENSLIIDLQVEGLDYIDT